jgi:hypothetical protein
LAKLAANKRDLDVQVVLVGGYDLDAGFWLSDGECMWYWSQELSDYIGFSEDI